MLRGQVVVAEYPEPHPVRRSLRGSRLRRLAAAAILCSLPLAASGSSLLRGDAAARRGNTGLCRSAAADAYWDYTDGGASWNVGQCCLAKGQSPKNLTAVPNALADASTLFWGYHLVERPVTMRNTGRVLSATLDADTGGLFMGAEFPRVLVDMYSIWKVEIHTPSEHTFGGMQVPLELQVFHRRRGVVDEAPSPSDVAVMSFGFVGGGQASPFLDALRQGGLPDQAGEEKWVNAEAPAVLHFAELFGPGVTGAPASAFWQYTGSLTMPPCSTGVQWFVRQDSLIASPATINKFKEAITAITPIAQKRVGNARNLQPPCGTTKVVRPIKDVSDKLDGAFKTTDKKFQYAAAHAQKEQAEFERSLNAPPPLYEKCMARLAEAARQLMATKERQKKACTEVEVHRQKLRTSGDGLKRLAAGQRLNGKKALCKQSATVIRALTSELDGGQSRCEQIKSATASSAIAAPLSTAASSVSALTGLR